MKKQESAKNTIHKDVLIALIGVFGGVLTTVLGNIDKFFPPDNQVSAEYTGYRLSGDLKAEIGYFIEISGLKDNLSKLKQSFIHRNIRKFSNAYPELAFKGQAISKILDEEFQFANNQILDMYASLAAENFTLKEIQEINKFYSTDEMREFVKKRHIFNDYLTSEMLNISDKYDERVKRRLAELDGEKE